MQLKIFRYFITSLALLVIGLSADAQNEQFLLWKISDHKQCVGYVFGTIHLSDSALVAWPKEFMDCYDQCDLIAGELNLIDEAAMMSAMSQLVMKDSTLEDLMSPEDFNFVQTELNKKLDPITLALSSHFKPFFTYSALLDASSKEPSKGSSVGSGKPSDMKSSLKLIPDYRLQSMAEENKKKVTGLETYSEQFVAIDKMSLHDQAKMLIDYLKNDQVSYNEMGHIKELYLNQDTHSMMMEMKGNDAMLSLEQALLTDRNALMAERLSELLKKQKVFCAIGAAHLAGENGVIQHLKNKGYTLQPIPFQFISQ